jgi:hypothetical protein
VNACSVVDAAHFFLQQCGPVRPGFYVVFCRSCSGSFSPLGLGRWLCDGCSLFGMIQGADLQASNSSVGQ